MVLMMTFPLFTNRKWKLENNEIIFKFTDEHAIYDNIDIHLYFFVHEYDYYVIYRIWIGSLLEERNCMELEKERYKKFMKKKFFTDVELFELISEIKENSLRK